MQIVDVESTNFPRNMCMLIKLVSFDLFNIIIGVVSKRPRQMATDEQFARHDGLRLPTFERPR